MLSLAICHIVCQYRLDNDLLTNNDLILIIIHHSVFDGRSTSIFLPDLSLTYDNKCFLPINDNTAQYVNYSVYERLIDDIIA